MSLKHILLCAFAAFSFSAQAESMTNLSAGDRAVSFIGDAKIISVENRIPDCPRGVMCDPTYTIRVELGLGGCFDKLGPYSTLLKYNAETQKYDLLISAVNIHNEASMRARCIKMPTETIEIRRMGLIGDQDSINLIVLQ